MGCHFKTFHIFLYLKLVIKPIKMETFYRKKLKHIVYQKKVMSIHSYKRLPSGKWAAFFWKCIFKKGKMGHQIAIRLASDFLEKMRGKNIIFERYIIYRKKLCYNSIYFWWWQSGWMIYSCHQPFVAISGFCSSI